MSISDFHPRTVERMSWSCGSLWEKYICLTLVSNWVQHLKNWLCGFKGQLPNHRVDTQVANLILSCSSSKNGRGCASSQVGGREAGAMVRIQYSSQASVRTSCVPLPLTQVHPGGPLEPWDSCYPVPAGGRQSLPYPTKTLVAPSGARYKSLSSLIYANTSTTDTANEIYYLLTSSVTWRKAPSPEPGSVTGIPFIVGTSSRVSFRMSPDPGEAGVL